MKKGVIVLVVLVLIILPVISADLIIPGFSIININNYITNIDNFPDYVFITAPINSYILHMCGISNLDRLDDYYPLQNYYKGCRISVYAVEKEKINLVEDIKVKMKKQHNSSDSEMILNEFEELEELGIVKEVIRDVRSSKSVFIIASTQKEINNYYTIDLNQVKTKPDRVMIKRNALFYWYMGISLIAIGIIIFLIIRRKPIKKSKKIKRKK